MRLPALLIIFCLTLSSGTVPAQAHNLFDAQMFYREGRFRRAADELEALIRQHKDNCEVHYLLANTYVCLRLFPEAKHEYALALSQNPNAKIKGHCVRAIEGLASYSVPKLLAATEAQSKEPEPSPEMKKKIALMSRLENRAEQDIALQEKKVQKQREEILEDAERRAELVKQEAKVKLEAYRDSHSGYWIERDTGRIIWELDPNLERAFMDPYDKEVARILEDAQRRVEGLGANKALRDITAGINKQIYSNGKGPQLDPTQTNLYLRTYNVPAKPSPQGEAAPATNKLVAGANKGHTH